MTYKNLQEMMDSPEYKELILKVYMGVRKGFVDVYPPLPRCGILNIDMMIQCNRSDCTGQIVDHGEGDCYCVL